jgi:hypothetical protein
MSWCWPFVIDVEHGIPSRRPQCGTASGAKQRRDFGMAVSDGGVHDPAVVVPGADVCALVDEQCGDLGVGVRGRSLSGRRRLVLPAVSPVPPRGLAAGQDDRSRLAINAARFRASGRPAACAAPPRFAARCARRLIPRPIGPGPFCPARPQSRGPHQWETAMQNQDPLTPGDLDQFTGTEHWYRHGLIRQVLFTRWRKIPCRARRSLLAAGRDCHRPAL